MSKIKNKKTEVSELSDEALIILKWLVDGEIAKRGLDK